MNNLLQTVSSFLRDEEGLTMVEYAIAGALIAAVAVAGFTILGTNVNQTANDLAGAAAAPGAP